MSEIKELENVSEELKSEDIEKELEEEEKNREIIIQKKKAVVKKADFFSSIVLFIFSMAMMIMSLKMPRAEITGSDNMWYAIPGLFPAFIAGVLIICSVTLFFLSDYRQCGGVTKTDKKKIVEYLKSSVFIRLVIAVALLAIYIFGLLGNTSYYLATFFYLFVTMFIFRPRQENRKKNILNIVILLIVTGVVTAAVGLGFAKFAQIPLP